MSEIGLKKILRTLGAVLQVKDVTQFPSELDTSSVKAVMSVGQGGWADRAVRVRQNDTFSVIAGSSNALMPYVSNNPNMILNQDAASGAVFDTRVLSLEYRILFDPAGAAAFAGKSISLALRYDDPQTLEICRIINLRSYFVVGGGVQLYEWVFNFDRDLVTASTSGFGWSGAVLHPMYLGLTAIVDDGTAFPGGTNQGGRIKVIQVPKGIQLPF